MALKLFYLSTFLPFLVLTFTTLSLSRGGEPPYYYGNDNSENNNPYSEPARDRPVYSNTHVRPSYSSSDNSYNTGYPSSETSYNSRPQYPSRTGYDQNPPPSSSYEYENTGMESQQNGNMGTGSQCTKKTFVTKDQIIDIQASVQYGAQLLDGMYARDFDQCISSCCEYSGCDLALFKSDGMSATGKTCYFVHCGLPEHCRMVDNPGFMAGFLFSPLDYGDILEDLPDLCKYREREREEGREGEKRERGEGRRCERRERKGGRGEEEGESEDEG